MKKYFFEIYFPLGIIVGPVIFMVTGVKLSLAFFFSIIAIMAIHLYLNKTVRITAFKHVKKLFSTMKKEF
ncbi:hypothetical protein [Mucilaginibacter gilvus]|uniref:Uncharacterized protein n=1 Tax=Mucilaginibacter gilvus TaxID=2305909 RepID=A0A444MHU5_9SPHI|nr:hypothetical protein [Mucilaginibacter gilvus]RWY47225.1 hypothetical protein EPL05_22330 [Mucilaginibacter gilvus]